MPKDEQSRLQLDEALAGLLALAVAARGEQIRDLPNARKSELILADAGLSAPQIAGLVNKNVDAVRKAIQRGRRK